MTTTTGRARLWAPARSREFRLLWAGQSLSLLGDGFSVVAFAWITLALTGSPLALGVVLAFQSVPRALLTLVGGSLSDRWSPRLVMTVSAAVRAVLMAGVGTAGLAGLLGLPALCAAAALFGAVDAFFHPARVSVLPSVVEPEMLGGANALLSVGNRTAAVLGPSLGGVLVAATGAEVAFLVDAACFAACALVLSRVGPRRPASTGSAAAEPSESLAARIRAGVRYALADPRIRAVLAVDTAVTFCYAGPFTVGFATLATAVLDGGPTALGLLTGGLAAGAIAGAIAGGTVGGRPGVGLLIAALTGWLAVGMALLGIVGNLAVAVAVVVAMGAGIGFQGVFGLSWIQRTVEPSVLSRVIALDMVLGYAVAPLSLVVCGALAQSDPALLFGGAAAVLLVTSVAVVSSRTVRGMS